MVEAHVLLIFTVIFFFPLKPQNFTLSFRLFSVLFPVPVGNLSAFLVNGVCQTQASVPILPGAEASRSSPGH